MKNKKLSIKSNRLLIIYSKVMTDKKYHESLRCTSLESARRIIGKRVRENIKSITFRNWEGEYQIV